MDNTTELSPRAVGHFVRQRRRAGKLTQQELGELAGVGTRLVSELERGKVTLRMDAVPISLTLPLRPQPYVSRGLHPFFENLLPEGWLLEVSSKKLKISKDDPFSLLLATCGDCVGAVEIELLETEAG